MMLDIDANCGYGVAHGDEKPDGDGDGIFLYPRAGMGTGMGMTRMSRGRGWESNTRLGNPHCQP